MKTKGVIRVFLICGMSLFIISCGLFVESIPQGKILNPTSYDHFVKINGINYHYTEYPGEKADIFMLHGFAASTYTWEEVATILNRDGYHVWALDMKGFGWSDKPKKDKYDASTFAEEVNTFMEVMGLKSTVFVGNSLGGTIAIIMSVEHPDKIDRMVLIDAGGYPMKLPLIIKLSRAPLSGITTKLIFGRWMIKWNLGEVIYHNDRLTGERVDAYYNRLCTKNALDAMVSTARAIDFDAFNVYTSRLSEVNIQTLIIWGRDDKWIPLENGYRFRKDLKNSTLFVIPECGHIPQEEYPEKTAQVLLDFIEGSAIKDTTILDPDS